MHIARPVAFEMNQLFWKLCLSNYFMNFIHNLPKARPWAHLSWIILYLYTVAATSFRQAKSLKSLIVIPDLLRTCPSSWDCTSSFNYDLHVIDNCGWRNGNGFSISRFLQNIYFCSIKLQTNIHRVACILTKTQPRARRCDTVTHVKVTVQGLHRVSRLNSKKTLFIKLEKDVGFGEISKGNKKCSYLRPTVLLSTETSSF